MIDIKKKEDCVGCNACLQRCPKTCISMHEDEQGFLYPKVDLDKCIDCHLCEKVCPVINQAEPRKPLHTYAAKNKNPEVQGTSSSGGVFFALVEYVITEKQGVVFGARFNDKWEVVHAYAENLEDARAFKGSKYVQSRICDNFKKAEEFLKAGRTVLFSGTPCQIAGLRLFLRKDYVEQLICVDFVCHGVPSPMVWRDYLTYITRPKGATAGKNTDLQSTLNVKMPVITGISFRDKRISWEKYGFAVHAVARKGDQNSDLQSTISPDEEQELLFETLDKNLYMQGFLKDLYLRPSCYACPVKCGKSHSDITLADFWGISTYHPELYDKTGVSLVLANTIIGMTVFTYSSVMTEMVNYIESVKGNSAIYKSPAKPKEYDLFWNKYSCEEGCDCIESITTRMRPPLAKRIKSGLVKALEFLLGKNLSGKIASLAREYIPI